MPEQWRISEQLNAFLEEIFSEARPESFSGRFPASGTEFFPCIMWSLGGEVRKGDQIIERLEPEYGLGWVRRDNLGKLILIESDAFGFIAFQPSKADASAPGRLIDIKERTIFVR
jgi:hypothetical protein